MADATSVSPETMDDEFEKGMSNAGLSGENRDFATSFLMSAAGGAIDPKLVKEASDYYDKLSQEQVNKRSVKTKDYLDRQTKLYDDLQKTQDRPMSGGEIIARAVIGLAPTLVGAAIGGMSDIGMGLGGSAGGTAALGGLKQMDDSIEKNKEAEKATIKGKIDAAKKLSEDELKVIGETERDIEKAKLQLPLLASRGAIALKLKEAAAKAKAGKDEVSWPSDLSAGFKFQAPPGNAYKPLVHGNVKEAQKKIGSYSNYITTIDRVIDEIGKGGIGKATKWTDAGTKLQSALSAMVMQGKEYQNLGAALTGNEQNLLMSMGIDPNGSIIEKFRLADRPEVLIDRLKALKSSLRNSVSAQVEPLGVIDTLKAQSGQKQMPKTVTQGGHTYTLNPKTGKYE